MGLIKQTGEESDVCTHVCMLLHSVFGTKQGIHILVPGTLPLMRYINGLCGDTIADADAAVGHAA